MSETSGVAIAIPPPVHAKPPSKPGQHPTPEATTAPSIQTTHTDASASTSASSPSYFCVSAPVPSYTPHHNPFSTPPRSPPDSERSTLDTPTTAAATTPPTPPHQQQHRTPQAVLARLNNEGLRDAAATHTPAQLHALTLLGAYGFDLHIDVLKARQQRAMFAPHRLPQRRSWGGKEEYLHPGRDEEEGEVQRRRGGVVQKASLSVWGPRSHSRCFPVAMVLCVGAFVVVVVLGLVWTQVLEK